MVYEEADQRWLSIYHLMDLAIIPFFPYYFTFKDI